MLALYYMGKSHTSVIPNEVELLQASQLGWPPATRLDLLFHPPADRPSGSSRRTWKGSSRGTPLKKVHEEYYPASQGHELDHRPQATWPPPNDKPNLRSYRETPVGMVEPWTQTVVLGQF